MGANGGGAYPPVSGAGGALLSPDAGLGGSDGAAQSKQQGMTVDELQAHITAEIQRAEQVQEALIPGREEAVNAYNGEPYGDEKEGRSKVVARDFRDVVKAIMPSLMRIFWGPERVAEFVARGPEDEEMAGQMTDMVDYVLKVDNPGFLVLYDAFTDALVQESGVIQWRWDAQTDISTDKYVGLTQEAAQLLASDTAAIDAEFIPEMRPDGTVDVEVRRYKSRGRAVVESVPPEELLMEAEAVSTSQARFLARRCYKPVSELVAMGYDREMVEEKSGAEEAEGVFSMAARRRQPTENSDVADLEDASSSLVLYVEAYPRVDFDGDGIAELRHVCCMGTDYEIVRNEPIDERPIANFCPDPVPHSAFGKGLGDILMDIQRVKTALERGILNSLTLAIEPRIGVVEGRANMDDLLNHEINGIIRMNAPGMVTPFTVPFVGREALDVAAHWDSVKQDRTGISKAAAGLDADALQSTTRAAVAATVSAAHQHIEMIARILAETGLRPAMRGIAKLLARHQDKARTVKLRGKWVEISPASWNVDADVRVDVAVGSATVETRLMTLERIAQRQEGILQQYGPSNPLVTVAQYRNTLAKMIELSGFTDPARFFSEVPADWQPPQQAPQQTPEQMLAEVQREEIRANIAIKQREMEMRELEIRLSDDRERDAKEADILLRAREIELKYQQAVDTAGIRAAMQAMRPDPAQLAPQQQQQGGVNA